MTDINISVSCSGVLVHPGDIVGCDWDGVLEVPIEVAEDVLYFAAKIAINHKKIPSFFFEDGIFFRMESYSKV